MDSRRGSEAERWTVTSRDNRDDDLARQRLDGAAEKRCDRCGTARLSCNARSVPEPPLCLEDHLVAHEEGGHLPLARDNTSDRSGMARPKAVDSYPRDRHRICRISRECASQGRGQLRLDGRDDDLSTAPERGTGVQPATTTGDKDARRRRLLLEDLGTAGGLARDDLRVVIGVDLETPMLFDVGPTRLQRVGIVALDQVEAAAVGGDPLELGHRGAHRHEDLCRHLLARGRPRNRCSVIASRGRDHARRGPTREQCIEGTAHLERSGVLQGLQLEKEPEPRTLDKLVGVDLEEWSATDPASKTVAGSSELIATGHSGHVDVPGDASLASAVTARICIPRWARHLSILSCLQPRKPQGTEPRASEQLRVGASAQALHSPRRARPPETTASGLEASAVAESDDVLFSARDKSALAFGTAPAQAGESTGSDGAAGPAVLARCYSVRAHENATVHRHRLSEGDEMTDLTASAAALQDDLAELRHSLHAEPEIGLDLPLTQAKVLDALAGLPLEIRTGEHLSSVVAVLRGGRPGPTVLLRGDMDALPILEQSDLAFRSRIDGAMHACGHDLHTSMLVGAAQLLAGTRADLAGDVVFMFQPGEEGYDGAGKMIAEGLLDASGSRPIAAYAIHVMSALWPQGTFVTRSGPMMAASDGLAVTVKGSGGHGSAPHRARDPIPAACEMALALQVYLTRSVDPFETAVLTVGSFHAGTRRNIIPQIAEFSATIRTFNPQLQSQIARDTVRVCEGIAAAHGLEVEAIYTEEYPVTVNAAGEAGFAGETAQTTFGSERFEEMVNPITGSEDFSRVLDAIPGAMVFLGAVPEGQDFATAANNHSAYAGFDDAVLSDGALFYAQLAADRLARQASGDGGRAA